MNKKFLAAALVAVFFVSPTAVQAKKFTTCEKAFTVRQVVIKKHGKRAPGRNICRLGVRYSNGVVLKAKYSQKKRYLYQLRQLAFPPELMRVTAVPPKQTPAGTLTANTTANLPSCTWRPESGGSYTAVNSSSGAYGKYQIMPFHWRNPKTCKGLDRSPSGQERCAAIIWKVQGSGAWVNC